MEAVVCALFLVGGVNSEGPIFTTDSVQVNDAPEKHRASEADFQVATNGGSFLAPRNLPEHPQATPLGPALTADTTHFTFLEGSFGSPPVGDGFGSEETQVPQVLRFVVPGMILLCLVCSCCLLLKCCCGECLGMGGGYQQPGCYDSTPYGTGAMAMAGAAGFLGGYEMQQLMGGGGGGYPMGGGGYGGGYPAY